MPFYVYSHPKNKCQNAGGFETFQKMVDDHLASCPECGAVVVRQITLPQRGIVKRGGAPVEPLFGPRTKKAKQDGYYNAEHALPLRSVLKGEKLMVPTHDPVAARDIIQKHLDKTHGEGTHTVEK